jgi:uncharacterized protein YhdP
MYDAGMFHRFAHAVLEGIVVLAMALVVLCGLAVWRLSEGPVPLDALLPYMAPALEDALPGFQLRLDGAELAWSGWPSGLDLRVRGVRVVGADGVQVAGLDSATLRLSRGALLRGRIAPTALGIEALDLAIERRQDGSLHVAGLGGETVALARLSKAAAEDAPAEPGEHLEEILASRAAIRIVDLASGATWQASDADLRLRFAGDGMRIEAALRVARGAHAVRLAAVAERPTGRGRVSASLAFDGVAGDALAAMLADLVPDAQRLAGVALPLDGRLSLTLDPELGLVDARARLAAADGGFLEDAALLPRRAGLTGFGAELRYDAAARRLDIERLGLGFAGGGSGEMRGSVSFDPAGAASIAIAAALRDVPIDSLDTFWPLVVAPNARDWITRNISGGMVDEASFDVALAGGGNSGIVATQLAAKVRFRGASVVYLAPMPPATGVDGIATIGLDHATVVTETGAVGGLRVESSRTHLSGLDGDTERADIQIAVRGPVREQLALLDRRPLSLLRTVALNPADFAGEASTRARFQFPLVGDLRVEQVAVSGTVQAKGFGLKRAALGQDARDGEVAGRFDEKGLSAAGRLTLGRIPVEVEYALGFLAGNPVRERIRANGTVSAEDLAGFGFDLRPLVEGSLPLAIDYTVRRTGPAELRIDAGLEQARLAVADAGWTKPEGVPGSAQLDLVLEGARLQRIRALRIAAGDADVAGRVAMAADGQTVQSVELDRLRFGRSDLRLAATRERDGGWRVRADGAALDLAPIEVEAPGGATQAASGDRPRLAIEASIRKVWLDQEREILDVVFSGERAAHWRRARIAAKGIDRLGRAERFDVDYRTDDRDVSRLTARTDNAGAMLRSLGVTDKVVGGVLEVSGRTEEVEPGRPLGLDIRMRDYRLVDEPALARFLSAALLTGLLDLLRGDGIGFDQLEARALLRDGDLVIRDLRSSGPSLGLQARGRLDIDGGQVDVEGTIVPANAVNSLFGRIPVLGQVLFGPGLFAARFSVRGPRDRPDVVINPLSALAPGVLRNIFGILEGGPAPPSAPGSTPGDQSR